MYREERPSKVMTECLMVTFSCRFLGMRANGKYQFQGKERQVVLNQIWTIDKSRLVRRLGRVSKSAQGEVLTMLAEMFAE